MKRPRVIFMGTPEFAVPALQQLGAFEGVELSLVVTQPDRPAGRGKKMMSPAVKIAAGDMGVPVLQTGSLRNTEVRQRIIDIDPDLIVVAAFGMILGKWILELPTHGCVNLHASLLPKYRGANPVAAAIACGEEATGVSLMRMDRGLDTGPVYGTAVLDIDEDDSTESLTPRLATLAGELLVEHLPELLAGTVSTESQGPGATLTRLMSKDDGWVDFSRSAAEIERHVRAMWPWPRAWTVANDGTRLQLHEVVVVGDDNLEPGEIAHRGRQVVVGTDQGALGLRRVQLSGRKPIEGSAILQNAVFTEGEYLGASGAPESLKPLVVPIDDR